MCKIDNQSAFPMHAVGKHVMAELVYHAIAPAAAMIAAIERVMYSLHVAARSATARRRTGSMSCDCRRKHGGLHPSALWLRQALLEIARDHCRQGDRRPPAGRTSAQVAVEAAFLSAMGRKLSAAPLKLQRKPSASRRSAWQNHDKFFSGQQGGKRVSD